MPLGLPAQFVVFDTEYTAWEGSKERDWSGPNEYRELVQIGAVKVTGEEFEITDTFSQFIKPARNPLLSPYFTQLTGITQAAVDQQGVAPRVALESFAQWTGGLPMYCYGKDGDVIVENCHLLEIQCPFDVEQFHNVKDIFSAHGIPADEYMSSTIVEAFGEKPARRGHDALHDAKSIVDGLRLLQKRAV